MGIQEGSRRLQVGRSELHHGCTKDSHRKKCKAANPYVQDLCKLYAFLYRRATSETNFKILRRLMMSKRNKMPVSLAKVAHNCEEGKVSVIAATVTDDTRLWECPKMNIVALKFTETARARIVAAGGNCMTFDQLAQSDPWAENVTLIRSDPYKRHSQRYMGLAPGARFSTTLERMNRKSNRVMTTDKAGVKARGIRITGNRLGASSKK